MSDFNRNELKEKKLNDFKPIVPAAPAARVEQEEFYEEEVTLFEKFKLVVPIIIIAIICFVAYAWYTDKFAISRSSADLPIIKANISPLREKPEDPGGMKIINRDKKVYDAISGKDNDNDAKSANVLPAPEEPIAHDEVVKNESLPQELVVTSEDSSKTTSNKDVKNENETPVTITEAITKDKKPLDTTTAVATKNELPVKTEVAIPTAAEKATKPTAAILPAVKEDTSKNKVKAVTGDDITDVAPAKKAQQKKVKKADSGYKLQLGSYRSTGDAEASWKAVKKKFPDILNGLNDYIEKADLGDKGIYYRLQLSGFKNESEARKVCQKLTEKKQGCFFVGK